MAFFRRNACAMAVAALLVLSAASTALGAQPAQRDSGFRNAQDVREMVREWPGAKNLSHYQLDLTLDPENKTLQGTLDFTYVNAEDGPMSQLHFLLYANSYRRQEYGIFAANEMAKAYPNGFSSGYTEVSSVFCENRPAQWAITGEQDQVLMVKLDQPVQPGQSARVRIGYTVTVPNCYGRFGYGEHTMSLVNCYPVLAVYDQGQWYDYRYYPVGDPFYSEVADYDATIRAPREWTLAATGALTRHSAGRDALWKVHAPARRDFGFCASDRFTVSEGTVDGITVRSYSWQQGGDGGALTTAMESLALFNQTYGPYPYGEFSVVQADFFIGGMEYPGMVLIDGTLYAPSLTNDVVRDLVVSHETAHQWWYGVVGGDEVQNPWLDEGLTEFSTQYFFQQKRSERYNRLYDSQKDILLQARQDTQMQSGNGAPTARTPVYGFADNTAYSAWVYDRTAAVLQQLRGEIGEDAFFAALRGYYEQSKLSVATADDLLGAFRRVSGQDWKDWFARRLASAE